jgi:hypothetical protein
VRTRGGGCGDVRSGFKGGGPAFGRTALRCLYGRLPCGKEFLRFWLDGINCGLISGLCLQNGQSPPLALMVIREVGAHLADGLGAVTWPQHRIGFPDPRSHRFTITSSTH